VIVAIAGWVVEHFHLSEQFLAIPPAAFYGFGAGIVLAALAAALYRMARPQPALPADPSPSTSPTPISTSSQIRILRNNAEMLADIHALVRENDETVHRVWAVQYSARNVKDVLVYLADLPNAELEVFVKEPGSAINPRQTARIQETLDEFKQNEISPKARARDHVRVYTYRAPGAVRAIVIDQRLIYIGCFLYRLEKISAPDLDARGGDVPLLVIPAGHPKFALISDSIKDMIKNWKDYDQAKPHDPGKKATA